MSSRFSFIRRYVVCTQHTIFILYSICFSDGGFQYTETERMGVVLLKENFCFKRE